MGIVLFLFTNLQILLKMMLSRGLLLLLDLLWEDIEMDSPINLALGLSGIGSWYRAFITTKIY